MLEYKVLVNASITGMLVSLYVYYLFSVMTLVKGVRKNAVFLGLIVGVFLLSVFMQWQVLGTIALLVISMIFMYFYNETPFTESWYWALPPAACLMIGTVCISQNLAYSGTLAIIMMLEILFVLLSFKRGYLHKWNAVLVSSIYLILMLLDGVVSKFGAVVFKDSWYESVSHILLGVLSILLFGLLEMTLSAYEKGFLKTTKELREAMIGQQYEEIQSIYLNVRGWRHDYHNHIQALKAILDQGEYERASAYLDTIENALRKVDTYVKSGNVMADAILNSKLSLAEQRQIPVTCDAFLPEVLFISDVDLCTLLGNVLDNAIESCEKLNLSERFIRIYLALNKEQLYLSVQNATTETPDIEQKRLISKKRGNHGIGVKRVAAVVNKWDGFLNVNQQPGVFAVEVMIPISKKNL